VQGDTDKEAQMSPLTQGVPGRQEGMEEVGHGQSCHSCPVLSS
jgi:hypothetical protein